MLLDSAVIAALIFIFARYNASVGLVYSFVMLFCVCLVTVVIAITLPDSLAILILPIHLLLLAIGLTVICGTQPKQTGKIIGCFLLFRLGLWGIGAALSSSL